jgi:phosphoesterase RecJ-like protein
MLELDGRLVHTHVLNEDYAAMGALPTDTEDVVNQALTVSGTEFAVIFVGLVSGGFKVSFRSRCQADCSQIAQHFGGGGHHAAAGATLPGAFHEVRDRVLPVVREALTAAS